ncbi:MAG TPA: hypothetical protein VNX15_03535 [Gemmatimonadales bacterium]|jgi:hypothetical protein|nr:hypothetical protein [Gemmatimonadales bacterium]
MVSRKSNPQSKTLWAYAYQIQPPQAEPRLRGIKALLDHEHGDAQRGARTWTGRLVLDALMTHILVVSDGPEQNREVNRKLEAELAGLKAGFALTAPMPVVDVLPL